MGKMNGIINIPLKVDRDFELSFNDLRSKYGEGFEYLNGLHESQLNFSDFIDGFIDKNVADATIDANANAATKDVKSLDSEKCKSEDKLFSFNKIFYDTKKIYGLKTAKEWFETEWNGGFYLHDASSSSKTSYCFSGETKILTDKGIYELQNIVGDHIKVLNKNRGWEDATVQCFGVQPLKKLTLERYGNTKEIFVTGNHKWFVRTSNGVHASKDIKILSTDELEPGDRIPFNASNQWSKIIPSQFGVAHGFFTGDGDKGIQLRANFCGDKTALIPYFMPAKINGSEREYVIYGIPEYFRYLPSTESLPYLYGWLSGYFAADGCVDSHGRCTIASIQKENLEFVRQVLCKLGMPVNEIRYQDRISNLTNEMGRVYILSLSEEYLPDYFFIRPTHKERISEWRKSNENRKERNWMVVSVEDTNRIEPVYCAVVKGTESFTLDGNILTHNCFAYDLSRLAKEGLFFLKNYNHESPKHLTTFVDDLIEYISYFCNRSSGAVGIPNVLIWTYYFWKKDCAEGYYLKDPIYYAKQSFQKIIYRLNQPFMRKL